MARRRSGIGSSRQPELDFVSYGRRGSGRPAQFTPEQIAQIARTVRRTPEVMVKVSGGGKTLGAVAAHFKYISRRGELEIETDDGERLQGKEVAKSLVEDWDLDLDAMMDRRNYAERGGRSAQPKLVHNIVLSMPAGTPPERLLAASRAFAREEFTLQHRYAMVLHTDQDHPHVHLVVSAHRREGGRLNIHKADLRRWRERFAEQLRVQGLAANATPAQVRGKLSKHQRDGAYRAALRGELRPPDRPATVGTSSRVRETAAAVVTDWRDTSIALLRQGRDALATEVAQFVGRLGKPGLSPEIRARSTEQGRQSPTPQQLQLLR